MKTTSLKTSQALKELVEVESYFWWERMDFGIGRGSKFVISSDDIDSDTNSFDVKVAPAYTLSELPSVLQAVGEKLGWQERYCSGCKRTHYNNKLDCDTSVQEDQDAWLYHFLHICELHARGEDWDEVLYELVTRR